MGVFATRSPFRPNSIGLSSVELVCIRKTEDYGTVLDVAGADLMDGTPILDIKPYIPYTDSHPDATGGFTDTAGDFLLNVDFPEHLLQKIPHADREALFAVLSHDPRPSYQSDPERVYGMRFGNHNIKFRIVEDTLTVLTVD